ncbi:MAG: carbon starvation protein A [Planctomycetales bacterium]
MTTIMIAVGAVVGYLIAYHTYGKWLSRKIFALDPDALVPSEQLRDDVDFVPTRRAIVFGHHFTSIAGTGPIVGPAIAVFWGWLPALLWVIFGSIFIGAVHDLGSLVVSLRNRGQTIGEVAGRMISPRAKFLFLTVLFLALTIVLAIFGLVIAAIFNMFPESVLSVWIEIPIAVVIGIWVYRYGGNLLWPSLIALVLMYVAIYVGAYYFPIVISTNSSFFNPIVIWTIILMTYCFVASVLPVWVLLQPRDYINSHQLILALFLLSIGLLVAGATNEVDLTSTTPAVADIETINNMGAPPIFPFLFITIACGAISGFHCLVSSGTSSKQLANERDAQYVGYGAMLLEGMLAVLVILACCAGVGMGKFQRTDELGAAYDYQPVMTADGEPLKGNAAWRQRYDTSKQWKDFTLGPKIGAFVEGGGNFLSALGFPLKVGIGIMAVLVASFAATTLDTATRLQRYVIQELAATVRIKWLTNKYLATALALICGFMVAIIPGPKGAGSGGLLLWPLFGATNQLLAGLAFMVIAFYLWRRNKPVWFAAIPLALMVALPAWAMLWQMFNLNSGWVYPLWSMIQGEVPWAWHNFHLWYFLCLGIMALQVWMVIEAVLMWPRAKGVLEEALPPLNEQSGLAGGRSC